MNLFDREFFPTPKDIVIKMAAPYAKRLSQATILEPSAGNGAILDVLCNDGIPYDYTAGNGTRHQLMNKADETRVYAIEKNPELQMILQQKGYKLLASDFLSFRPEHEFDLVIMNPPFSNGATHLLYAWDILRGGDIACLLNAETVLNPCTTERKRLLAIIKDAGSVEHLGPVFHTADNPTDVEVALVRLHKEAQSDPFRLDLEGFAADVEEAPDFGTLIENATTPAINNSLDAYVRCWKMTKKAAIEMIKAYARLRFYACHLLPKSERGQNIMEHILKSLRETRYDDASMANVYNKFLDTTKSSVWSSILEQIGLGKYMTTGLREKLDRFRTAQGTLEISQRNIWTLFNFIMDNIGSIMDQTVTEVYDMFTRFHKDNTSCEEGWKTNKKYRCNEKVILPYVADAGYMPEKYGYNEYFRPTFDAGRKLDDIDKAMCWLAGKDFEEVSRTEDYMKRSLNNTLKTIPVGDQRWYCSAFFHVKAFKKGTIHLKFRDVDLLNKFNITVNQGKNQLGEKE